MKVLNAIIGMAEHWKLLAVTDPSQEARTFFQSRALDVSIYTTVEEMLDGINQGPSNLPVTAVYVAVPHYCYIQFMPTLLAAHFHVLKEKPAATTVDELLLYQGLAKSNSVLLGTAGQRRYGSAMARMKE